MQKKILTNGRVVERGHRIVRRLVITGLVFIVVALGAMSWVVQAEARAAVLTHDHAIELLRDSGVAVHRCQRRSPVYFHCWVTYWLIYEEEEWSAGTGSWEVVSEQCQAVDTTADVGLKGVRVN